MKNTDKVTLTFGQLKKLIKESKHLNERLDDLDLKDRPFKGEKGEIIAKYNKLEKEALDAFDKVYNSPELVQLRNSVDKIQEKLYNLHVFPGGQWTEDGPTGEDYWMRPQIRDKYESDPKFKKQVDTLKEQYESLWDKHEELIKKYAMPAAKKFNRYHNEVWRKLRRGYPTPYPLKDVPEDRFPIH